MATPTTTTTTKASTTRKARKPAAGSIILDRVKNLGRDDAYEVWGKLVDEHPRPLHVAEDWDWREARALESLTKLANRLGREATDRERAVYLTSWMSTFGWRVDHAEQEFKAFRPTIAKYNRPQTPPELANALRHFLLGEFDAAIMSSSLINDADFEIGIGHAEMTVAVISQGAWYRCKEAVNAAIKADLKR